MDNINTIALRGEEANPAHAVLILFYQGTPILRGDMNLSLTEATVRRLVSELIAGVYKRSPFIRAPEEDNKVYVAFDAIEIHMGDDYELKIRFTYENKDIVDPPSFYFTKGSTLTVTGFEGAFKADVMRQAEQQGIAQ